MHTVRVIGIGSAYGDDQLGWVTVERLAACLPADYPVSCLRCESPNQLFWLISEAKLVILIDAVYTGKFLGMIHRWQDAAIADLPKAKLSSHGVVISQIWTLANNLQCAPDESRVYGIEINPEYVDFQCSLSSEVETAVDKLLLELTVILKAYFEDNNLCKPLTKKNSAL
jgi:hydrogenase maturation protease